MIKMVSAVNQKIREMEAAGLSQSQLDAATFSICGTKGDLNGYIALCLFFDAIKFEALKKRIFDGFLTNGQYSTDSSPS